MPQISYLVLKVLSRFPNLISEIRLVHLIAMALDIIAFSNKKYTVDTQWSCTASHFQSVTTSVYTQSIGTPDLLTILVLNFEKKSILLPVDVSNIVLEEWQTV